MNAVKQQYIRDLTHVWLYFVGRWNMATAASFRDFRAWDWSFSFPTVIVDSPSFFEPSVLVSGMMSSCFAKGPHTPQWRINTTHVLLFPLSNISVSISLCSSVECVWCRGSSRSFGRVRLSNGEATLASDEFTGHCLHYFGPRASFSSSGWIILSVNNVKFHTTHVFLCCKIDFLCICVSTYPSMQLFKKLTVKVKRFHSI